MPLMGDTIALLMLFITTCIQLVSTVWWAASITKRVEHIERWIANNEHTAERLVALEQQIVSLGDGIARLEHFLRSKS